MSMLPSHRRSAVIAALILVTAVFRVSASSAQTEPITYNFVDYPALENGWQVGGSITTDGTLGVITYANVWGACMEVTGPGGTFYAYDYTPYLDSSPAPRT